MSTQLILYPQTYQGIYSFNSENEFVVDGVSFISIDGATSYSTAGSIDNHLFATPPSIINTWFKWRSTDAGTPAYPVETSGNLVLNAVAPASISGVYQKLSNLTVGASYTLTVNMVAVAGFINLKAYNLTTNSLIGNSGMVTSNTTQQTLSFTAQTTTDTVAILYINTGATDLTIYNISLIPTGTSPSETYTDLIDGQVICDLYQEEDIPLTLSIDDFKNVAEKVQSYSKDFNLPATKRNNRIFNNMYEITRADDGIIFNPYIKTKCVLKQDGFILFEGYLRLIDVKDKEGEISYNVNLYSEVIALADVLKEATFSNLDFTELTHNYNKQQIKRSWNESPDASITYTNPSTSGFRETYDTLRYPFIDWTHQYLVGGTGSGTNATAGNPELTSLQQAFKPCIQLRYLINRIFAASGFNWTSNFFDSADFGKLYMDFNWGADLVPFIEDSWGEGHVDSAQTGTTSFVTIQTNNNTFDDDLGYSAGVYTASHDVQIYNIYYSYSYDVTNNVPWSATFRWKMVKGGVTSYINEQPVTGTGDITNLFGGAVFSSLSETLNTGDTLTPEFKSATASTNDFYIQILGSPGPNNIFGTVGATYAGTIATSVTNNTLGGTLRGELGQWDFLKGIMTMFNLVSMVDENNPDNILIEPYADIFINNTRSNDNSDMTLASRFDQKVHDWTDKVDVSEMELMPLTDLNKNTIFKFVEDNDDYAFNVYKKATSGRLYGSLVWDASGFTILQGEEEIIAEPFAATVSKPLDNYLPMFIVPTIHSMADDGTSEGFDNSPRIFYNNGIKETGASYFIPTQNGVTGENQTDFLQFSHLSAVPSVAATKDFVFKSEQLVEGVGGSPTDNLYNTYWSPYFNELYSPDTRTMTLKVNLSPADVASFKFYDTVFIKNRAFRVNKIEYKPNDLAKVEFILIP